MLHVATLGLVTLLQTSEYGVGHFPYETVVRATYRVFVPDLQNYHRHVVNHNR